MSYDFHIEESGKSLEEWIVFAQEHPSLKMENEAKGVNPKTGEVIQIGLPNSAQGPSGIWFVPRGNENQFSITIYSPSEKDIPFLKQVVSEFGGKLVGDEGEEY